MIRALPVIPMILLLSACGEEIPHPVAALKPETRVPHHAPTREDGPAAVIGASAETLVRRFGTPRLDIRDGDARKLQWSGTACILDAYLYPGDHGGPPSATYVDARRGDGREVDKTACVAALRKD